MKQEVVSIKIFSKNTKSAEELKNAIIKESKYFKEKVDNISNIKDLDNIKDVSILIVIIDNESKNILKEHLKILESKVNEIILIDKNTNLLTKEFNTYRNIRIFSELKDNRAIAFSILYNYYEKLRNKREKYILKDQTKKFKSTMKKFEASEEIKVSLSDSIDKILMENLSHNSIGYEDFKTMIMFCVINGIDIDEERNYEYIYKALSKINNKRIIDLNRNIRNTLSLIRNRKKKLKIQKVLSQIKNKQVVEQVILISKEIKEKLNKSI